MESAYLAVAAIQTIGDQTTRCSRRTIVGYYPPLTIIGYNPYSWLLSPTVLLSIDHLLTN